MSSETTQQPSTVAYAGDPAPKPTAPVVLSAEARLPTPNGTFVLKVFKEEGTGKEHLALVMGEMGDDVLTRVHSECMTGDVFGSLRCDCGPQLNLALERVGQEGRGVVVYLRQEGRGIGLLAKIRAYQLQDDEGLDTVEANHRLGFPADMRNFDVAAQILDLCGVTSVRLMTNNPRKVSTLESHGVKVTERVPVRSATQSENERYLATKATKLGHQIDWI